MSSLPITPAPPVSDQPHVTLRHWRIYDLASGERLLAGQVVETGRGRVTTAVMTLDVRELRATTQSGRVYRLEGGPDTSGTAELVWSLWVVRNFCCGWSDATEDVWAAHLRDQELH